jgi:hypothetical protein
MTPGLRGATRQSAHESIAVDKGKYVLNAVARLGFQATERSMTTNNNLNHQSHYSTVNQILIPSGPAGFYTRRKSPSPVITRYMLKISQYLVVFNVVWK